jgi:hypothetical protein
MMGIMMRKKRVMGRMRTETGKRRRILTQIQLVITKRNWKQRL